MFIEIKVESRISSCFKARIFKIMEKKGGKEGLKVLEKQMDYLLKGNHLGWKSVMLHWMCTIHKRLCSRKYNLLNYLLCFHYFTEHNIVCPLYFKLLWKNLVFLFYSKMYIEVSGKIWCIHNFLSIHQTLELILCEVNCSFLLP